MDGGLGEKGSACVTAMPREEDWQTCDHLYPVLFKRQYSASPVNPRTGESARKNKKRAFARCNRRKDPSGGWWGVVEVVVSLVVESGVVLPASPPALAFRGPFVCEVVEVINICFPSSMGEEDPADPL